MATIVKSDRPCRGCGEPTNRRHWRHGWPQCGECALEAATSASRQMAARSGPAYEKWRESMRRMAQGLD